MKIGYARVSTSGQNLDSQIDTLKAAGCEHIFTDKISGTKSERPGLDKMLAMIRRGDTVIVWKLDRLGRSLKHLMQLVEEFKSKEINFNSLQENIDTGTPTGKFFFHIFATLCEFEREMYRERTMAGLESARARGRVGGRPLKLTMIKQELLRELYNGKKHTIKQICDIIGISKPAIYNYLKLPLTKN